MMKHISRREALKKSAWLLGSTLSASTVAGILNGCSAKPELLWSPKFFDENQAKLINTLAEIILPETDTKGAVTLGVPGFIEEMAHLVISDKEKDKFSKGMRAFSELCERETQKDFNDLNDSEQQSFVARLLKREQSADMPVWKEGYRFFRKVRELTIVGFFTTEYGCTQVLQYQAIPVDYNACVPLNEAGNGKNWATR
ncbi:MAG: gluconate 2-dehydrogenase subunit 3 family protein [Cyclobacteriaceae bacterium]